MFNHYQNIYNSEEGFTIVEMFISMALFVLLLSGVGTMFISSLNSAQITENKSLLKSKSQIIMARLGKDLRGAAEIANQSDTWPNNELCYKFDSDLDNNIDHVGRYHFDPNTNSLISYQRFNSSYPSDWSSHLEKQFIAGDKIKIVRQKDNNGNKLDVFSYDSDLKLLKIRFTLLYTHKKLQITYSVNDSIKLRNVGNFDW
ncbi:PilW family protein [Halanaerobacter jeridensis]|uniref:Type II secretory pathway pseudopilin PulG n=1 Tax=Halanaerobacter jeridensis TaxID=706427 RepID=A0A938XXA0_9FIRM|nr:hypothetical protein [Halanaerobacter jeridensis]MBM7557951.1 type II secretory pathway pseudopilin PulG [Halanaerobacter jeridensis]